MKFIFGPGNPGMKYSKTRHNIGFMALDCLAKTYGVRFKSAPKLSSKIALTVIGDETAVLVKPTTYMNNSGYAVSAVLDYYGGSADDIVVIYDDVDIPQGSLRIRKKGSAGTHNGMRNIIEYLETEDFTRIRVGIGKAKEYLTLKDHVLSKFPKDDIPVMEEAVKKAAKAAVCILEEGPEKAQSEYNG